jgi:hypothetical protein
VAPLVEAAASTGPRVLIVLLGAIGDVVRALPLAMRLRRGLPEARLSWAVEPTAAPLLAGAISARVRSFDSCAPCAPVPSTSCSTCSVT